MLVGLSLSRCIRDIADSKVSTDDVLCIISRTDFNFENSKSFESLWQVHSEPSLVNMLQPLWHELDRDAVYSILDELWFDGKIHQPAQWVGSSQVRKQSPITWMECIIPPGEDNIAARQAYQDYKLISDLTT